MGGEFHSVLFSNNTVFGLFVCVFFLRMYLQPPCPGPSLTFYLKKGGGGGMRALPLSHVCL